MEDKEKVTIWPILYFHAKWPLDTYEFDLGVRILKADKELLKDVWGHNYSTEHEDDIYNNTEWFLVLSLPQPTEHVSIKEIGISFENEFQEAIVDSFLMCLRLTRQTAAICPIKDEADLIGGSIDAVRDNDYWGIDTEAPLVFKVESFKIEDIQLLTELWTSIIQLRNLNYWANKIYKEEFFAKLDNKAVEEAEQEFREMLLSHPAADDPEVKKAILSIAEQAKSEDSEWWRGFYSDCFRKAFKAEEDETFSNRTRIGRALNLFSKGLLLPKLHSFLSMCLVLETLFTIGKGETVYKFALRLAKTIGYKESLEKRKEIYKRAKKVYDARSNIVHGEKLIEAIPSEVLKDAFVLTRQSLQKILLDSKLLTLYLYAGKTDKALKDYFLDLDLSL